MFYTYNGGQCGDDFTANPEFDLTIHTDSLASFSSSWTGGDYREGEQQFVIHAALPGQTTIDLEASWFVETATDGAWIKENFEIALITF